MMAIQGTKNLYRGINAHLNSLLQNEPGDWEGFHSDHIADLRRLIDAQLPEGYYARNERSLQIRELPEAESGARRSA